MAKVLTGVKRVSIFRRALALIVLTLLLFPVSVKASTYGSGNYGACEFQDGCVATPDDDSDSTDTTDTTGSSDTTDSTNATDETGTTIVLNTFEDFFSAGGVDITDIEEGDVIEFCIGSFATSQICDASSDTHHTVTLKSINLKAGTVVIAIASKPINYTLKLDNPKQIDIDKDKTDDIEMTLTALSATTANVTFRSLYASTSTPTDTNEDVPKAAESSSMSWLWWLLGGLGFLALLGIIIAVIKKKRGGGSSGPGYGSGPMVGSTPSGKPDTTASSNFSASTSFTPDSYTQHATTEMNDIK